MNNHLSALRAVLQSLAVQGFILPVNDEFMGEYVPASARRLEWLTGFTGSAGMAVIAGDKAAFFTDGRYTLQAKAEVTGFELHNSGDVSPEAWLAAEAEKGSVIGYDPRLHTAQAIQRYQRTVPEVEFRPVECNPVDGIWEGRPAAPQGPVRVHPLAYAGEDSSSKRRRMGEAVGKQGADVAILTAPDSVCWLLNIRGDDVPYTPFTLGYALLCRDFGKVFLFVDPVRFPPEVLTHLGAEVEICHPDSFATVLSRFRGGKVLYDKASSPVWFLQLLQRMQLFVVEGVDPCQLAKAVKNPVELEGMRAAHRRDGVAVVRFLHWLDKTMAEGGLLTECKVAEKLESFRRMDPLFREPSFATISGSGPDGAIVHYHATVATDRALDKDSLLLLDSGGQYPDGTTDVTRTVALGKPTAEMRAHFTRVLKGHIALASARFPEGTRGSQLDVLARQFLWQIGLDYDHGTGHGVGSYLSVHEGPQRISKRGDDVALQAGMVLSNEPGYYQSGSYGIRIENLVAVKEVGKTGQGKGLLAFETLTQIPIDGRLIEGGMLTPEERDWLGAYHAWIGELYAQMLSTEEAEWLAAYGKIEC